MRRTKGLNKLSYTSTVWDKLWRERRRL